MLKLILFSMIASVLGITMFMSSARADVVSATVDCSSTNDNYVQCETNVAFTDAKLDSEAVAGSCVFGSTWGTYDTSIWVNHGCSGRFTVTNNGGNQPVPQPVPTPAPLPPAYQIVDCRWNSVNWQPWYKTAGRFIGRPGFGFQDGNACAASIQQSHGNGVCNWTGNGFTPYDISSNRELVFAAYPTIESCYASY